jgi:hypothetical protein
MAAWAATSGENRPVRDDILDTAPHGNVNLARGIAVSCNSQPNSATGLMWWEPSSCYARHQMFRHPVASPKYTRPAKESLTAATVRGQVVASPPTDGPRGGGQAAAVWLGRPAIAGRQLRGNRCFVRSMPGCWLPPCARAVTDGTGRY